MKNLFTLFIAVLLSSNMMAQFSGYYFNILEPQILRTSHAPGEFGPANSPGWGWDGTIPCTIPGELVSAPAGVDDEHWFCEPSTDDFTGKFVLVERGGCEFSEKALNAQNQGAIGIFIINFENNLIGMAPGTFGADVTIPVIMITLDAGTPLANQLENNVTVQVELSLAPLDVAHTMGQVRFDENLDCMDDANETGLSGWQVVMSDQSGNAKTAYTNSNGEYHTFSGLGTYDLNVVPPNNYWTICNNNQSVIFTDYDTAEVNFNVQVVIECPQMTVDIEIPFLRRCFNNNRYYVDYCNLGTVTALDAYAQITFDPLLSIVASSIAYTDLGNNQYQFDLGDVGAGECGDFNIDVEVSCDADFGQSLCAEAFIFPDTICTPPTSAWTGSELYISGQCNGNEVNFEVINEGTGAMSNASNYKVFKNSVEISNGNIQLAAGATETFTFTADGATYRFEAAQADDFPLVTNPSRTIEACSPNNTGIAFGFANMFPAADYGGNHDEECTEVRGAFDPNDKQGFPIGFGEDHYIERGVNIEYLIRFQNTGTDTAFNVVVLDALSDFLDPASIRLGVSSHDYEFMMLDGNVMEFRFPDIMLPDSNINEPASHGFITFTASQKTNLPLESVIENTADIYFDFNKAVVTNTTFHTVGEDFWEVTSTHQILSQGVELEVYPNPMTAAATFDLGETGFENGTLQVFDLTGKTLRTSLFDQSSFTFNRNDLPAGAYFYLIKLDGQDAVSGKLMIGK